MIELTKPTRKSINKIRNMENPVDLPRIRGCRRGFQHPGSLLQQLLKGHCLSKSITLVYSTQQTTDSFQQATQIQNVPRATWTTASPTRTDHNITMYIDGNSDPINADMESAAFR